MRASACRTAATALLRLEHCCVGVAPSKGGCQRVALYQDEFFFHTRVNRESQLQNLDWYAHGSVVPVFLYTVYRYYSSVQCVCRTGRKA